MKQLELEMAHQKVKYDTQITEAETSMKQLQQTHEREVHTIYKYMHMHIYTQNDTVKPVLSIYLLTYLTLSGK